MKYENGTWMPDDSRTIAALAKEQELFNQSLELVKLYPTAKSITEFWQCECRGNSLDELEQLIDGAMQAKQAALLAMIDEIVSSYRDESNLAPGSTWHGTAVDAVWLDNQLQVIRVKLGGTLPRPEHDSVPDWHAEVKGKASAR